jgi:hypothetical protein
MAETNAEGLNIAAVLETSQGADPAPTTGWLNLEADAVGDPGPAYKKMARSPFTVTRQLRRPFISGLDCALTLDLDAIKDHVDFFGPAMFKSDWKHSGGSGQSGFIVSAVTDGGVSADGFTVAADGDILVNTLFVTRGFTNDENNGVFVATTGSTDTSVKVATGTLVAETPPANAQLDIAGFQFAAGDLELDVDGNFTTTAKDCTTLGLNVGQVGYIPSAAEALAMGSANYGFTNAAYAGFFKITAITTNKITVERRGWTVGAATTETTTTIRMFFTKWIRNVARSHADENLASHCFEVTYPGLASGPADAYEYLRGYMLDQVTFNMPAEGKVSMQMTFIGMTADDPGTVRDTGPSTALNVVTSLAMSTAADITRLSVDNVDETGLMSDFADLKIILKNNIQPHKAVGHLGNRFTPLGVFEAQVEAEVYFTDEEMVTAVHDNRILRLAAGMRNDDFGMVIDIPSTGAMESPKKIEHNKLIEISSKIAGFMDATSGYTAAMSVFAYLPTV